MRKIEGGIIPLLEAEDEPARLMLLRLMEEEDADDEPLLTPEMPPILL